MKNFTLYLPFLVALAVCGSKSMASEKPPVYLNHFYITVDPVQYKAIADSDFLKDTFGVFLSKNTIRKDRAYSGLYFYGFHTYIEFHNSQDPLVRPTDPLKPPSAIVFGVDRTGDAAAIGAVTCAGQLTAKPVELDIPDGKGGTKSIPWFRMWRTPVPPSSILDTFMMEYDPGFLKTASAGSSDGVTRREILDMVANNNGVDRHSRLFSDVAELDVELSAAEQDVLIQEVTDFGGSVENKGSQVILSTNGQKIVSHVGPANRIVALKMILTRKQRAQTIPIGATTVLQFNGDKMATWFFNKGSRDRVP